VFVDVNTGYPRAIPPEVTGLFTLLLEDQEP